jgi:hypothetical protein
LVSSVLEPERMGMEVSSTVEPNLGVMVRRFIRSPTGCEKDFCTARRLGCLAIAAPRLSSDQSVLRFRKGAVEFQSSSIRVLATGPTGGGSPHRI